MNNIFDILDAWGLLEPNVNLNIYSRKDIKSIAEDIEGLYRFEEKHSLGRAHLGITDSIHYIEGDMPISKIAMPLLMFNQLWMPDPIFSFLSFRAQFAWSLMPDSGSNFFSSSPSIYTQWATYWGTPKEQRKEKLLQVLPKLLDRMRKIKPLYEDGALAFLPWETIVDKHYKSMQKTINTLLKHEISEVVTTKYLQKDYNLGLRIGSIGIELNSDDLIHGLKAGTPLWIGDKTPIYVCGILNTLITEILGASFISNLPGDRLIHDFIRSGGYIEPPTINISNSLCLPRLSEAVWDDIIAVRKDSESLALLRSIISEVQSIDEFKVLDSIREKIDNANAKIKNDSSLWKIVGGNAVEVMIGGIGGFIAGMASGTPAPLSAWGAGAGAAVTFLWQLYKGFGDNNRNEQRKRIDILTRIVNNL